MPDTPIDKRPLPRDYPHMMRGPRFAWWRSLLAIPLALLFAIVLMGGLFGILTLAGQGPMLRRMFQGDGMDPISFGVGNLVLGCLVPATLLAARIMHGVRPGFVSSVTGSFRWRWAMRCTLITVPLYVITFALDQLINGPQGSIPAQQGLLLLMVLIGTPVQAAGEEYLFRGLLMQNVGAWFTHPTVALVMSTALSTGLFAAAHGSSDIWVLLDLGVFALACCILIWRTGGIEAAVVLHAVSNMVGMVGTIFLGGWSEGFVDEKSVGKPQDLLLTILVTSVAVPLVLWAAKRYGIERVYRPPADQRPPVDAAGSQRMSAGLWTVVIVPLALAMLVAAGGVLMLLMKGMPHPNVRLLHYADIATPMGITSDGCLKGYLVKALPIEIRHFDTNELVADDMVIKLGEQTIRGGKGEFQFPISAGLMAANPEFRVMRPDGRFITYRYKFVNATVKASGKCATPTP